MLELTISGAWPVFPRLAPLQSSLAAGRHPGNHLKGMALRSPRSFKSMFFLFFVIIKIPSNVILDGKWINCRVMCFQATVSWPRGWYSVSILFLEHMCVFWVFLSFWRFWLIECSCSWVFTPVALHCSRLLVKCRINCWSCKIEYNGKSWGLTLQENMKHLF